MQQMCQYFFCGCGICAVGWLHEDTMSDGIHENPLNVLWHYIIPSLQQCTGLGHIEE